jgi:hypothetical protein
MPDTTIIQHLMKGINPEFRKELTRRQTTIATLSEFLKSAKLEQDLHDTFTQVQDTTIQSEVHPMYHLSSQVNQTAPPPPTMTTLLLHPSSPVLLTLQQHHHHGTKKENDQPERHKLQHPQESDHQHQQREPDRQHRHESDHQHQRHEPNRQHRHETDRQHQRRESNHQNNRHESDHQHQRHEPNRQHRHETDRQHQRRESDHQNKRHKLDHQHQRREPDRQQERHESNHQYERNQIERKQKNRTSTLRQRKRLYRYEIIRRGIDPRFSVTIVKEILRRYEVPYTLVQIARSKFTRRTSLYIGIRNPSKIREYERRTRQLFTTDYYNEFRTRHRFKQ